MRHRGCFAAATTLLGLVAACDVPAYDSEQHQLGLMMDGFSSGAITKPLASVDAVVGSRLCPRFDGWYEHADGEVTYHVRDDDSDDDGWLRECFALGTSGAVRLDGQCLVLDLPGDAALQLTPRSCATQESSGIAFTADRLVIASWALDEVVLRYDDPFMRQLVTELVPGEGASFPPPVLPDPSEPLRAVTGGGLLFVAQPFVADDALHPVGYDGGIVRAVGDGVRPELQQQLVDGWLAVAEGDRFTVDLQLAAGTLHGGEIVAVDGRGAASLELLVGYERLGAGHGPLQLALAIVRDGEGSRLYGVPVEFEADGFAVGQVVADAMIADDLCEGREGASVQGTLHATYRELVASADVEFECPVADEQPEPDVEHDDAGVDDSLSDDMLGCACDVGGADPRGAALALCVAFALRRRRFTRPAGRPAGRAPARIASSRRTRSGAGT